MQSTDIQRHSETAVREYSEYVHDNQSHEATIALQITGLKVKLDAFKSNK